MARLGDGASGRGGQYRSRGLFRSGRPGAEHGGTAIQCSWIGISVRVVRDGTARCDAAGRSGGGGRRGAFRRAHADRPGGLDGPGLGTGA
jgi:hypothetical protein